MSLVINQIECNMLRDVSQALVILPENYINDEQDQYHSTSISFYKFTSEKLPVEYLSKPEVLVEQRSGEWFAPVLMFTSSAINQHPEIVSLTFTIIKHYVGKFFKGQKEPPIQLKVLYKETKSTSHTELIYKGSVDGLNGVKEAVLEIVKKEK